MSFPTAGLPLVDATDWPDTVTLTQTYDYDSGKQPDGSSVTITGTATWTWNLVSVVNYLQSPDLLCSGFNESLNTGDLVVVRCGVGKMPGWLAYFGPQDTQTGAFTRTLYPSSTPPNPPNPKPVVTMIDADTAGGVYASCAPCAPGRFVVGLGSVASSGVAANAFVGINDALAQDESNTSDTTPVDVQLLQAGFPADAATNQPEIGPVYRLSGPSDARYVGDLTVVTSSGSYTSSGYIVGNGEMANLLQGTIPVQFAAARSPMVADIMLWHASDAILSASFASYGGGKRAESNVTFNYVQQTIDDPFSLPGQSFTDDRLTESNGFTVKLQF